MGPMRPWCSAIDGTGDAPGAAVLPMPDESLYFRGGGLGYLRSVAGCGLGKACCGWLALSREGGQKWTTRFGLRLYSR
jgi:hypothetical protein